MSTVATATAIAEKIKAKLLAKHGESFTHKARSGYVGADNAYIGTSTNTVVTGYLQADEEVQGPDDDRVRTGTIYFAAVDLASAPQIDDEITQAAGGAVWRVVSVQPLPNAGSVGVWKLGVSR